MLSTLRQFIQKDFSPFQFDVYDDQLFWAKWFEYSVACDDYFAKVELAHHEKAFSEFETSIKDSALHRLQVLRAEIHYRHIAMRFGYFLQALHMMVVYVQLQQRQDHIDAIEHVYFKMFDEALETADFEFDQGMMRASMEVLISLYVLVQADPDFSSEQASRTFLLSCENFIQYVNRTRHHLHLVRDKLVKSECFRLDSESMLQKNQTIIRQYIGNTDIPEFARSMLMNYWALKMSLVQTIGKSSIFDWQFYWNFVTRFVRYFRTNQAMSSPLLLNDEFEFLRQYVMHETGGFDVSYENSKFSYEFREFHLQRISMVKEMQKAKRHQKPTDFKLETADSNNADRCYVDQFGREYSKRKPLPLAAHAKFWYEDHNICIPCELSLIYQDDICVLAFDHGRQTMTMNKQAFIDQIVAGTLRPRLSGDECHATHHHNISFGQVINF